MTVTESAIETATFAEPRVELTWRPDGSARYESREPLGAYEHDLGAPLYRWATERPDTVLAAERDAQDPERWRELTYGDARDRAEAVAQALLDRGLGPDRPLAVLAGNSLEHLVLVLAGYVAGIPVASLGPGYAHPDARDRLRRAVELVGAGGVYVGAAQLPALAALRDLVPFRVVGDEAGDAGPVVAGAARFGDLLGVRPGAALAEARAGVEPDTVAKILLTSGSTGDAKGVPNTHRMLCAVQQIMRQVWPFLATTPITLVDWLPWSHTFGGNHNLNMVLISGGTLYLDDGGPSPEAFARTRRNLAGRSPEVYFNVPAGFAALADALEADRAFATEFFARLRLLLNAGAPLSDPVRRRVLAVAAEVADHPVRFTASWGMTETASAATSAHHPIDTADAVGVPLPGLQLKLAPVDGRYELRVKGPTVMRGYLGRPEPDADAFDEEGYFRTGDAVRLVDEDDCARGLAFDGRLAEDFKLATGTWVRVGALRAALLERVPRLADVVVAGSGRGYVAVLGWLRPGAAVDQRELAAALAALNQGAGSSRRVERLLLLDDPPVPGTGELTAKGTVNQRRALVHRAERVEHLYLDPCPADVVTTRACPSG